MPAGALRESVTFQRRGPLSDGMGNTTTDVWAAIGGCEEVAAQLKPIRQGEISIAEGVQPRTTFEVTIRATAARESISVGDRMIDTRSSRTFNVKSAPTNPDQRGRYLKILVERGGADG